MKAVMRLNVANVFLGIVDLRKAPDVLLVALVCVLVNYYMLPLPTL